MCCGMLIGTTDSYLSLLPVARETVPLVEGNWLHKFLRNVGFCITARNGPIVQVEFIFGYLNYLLGVGELEFPLDMTIMFLVPWVTAEFLVS